MPATSSMRSVGIRTWRISGSGTSGAWTKCTIEYVRGRTHTNTAENFWALLKRALGATYVSVDPEHLFRYVDEEAYRFNTRKVRDGGRLRDLLPRTVGRRLTHRELVGEA